MNQTLGSALSTNEIDAIHQEALEIANIGVMRYKIDGTVVYMDKGALRILGLESRYPDPSEVSGKIITDLIVYIRAKQALRKEVLKKKHISNLEYPFITLDGDVKWALNDYRLIDASDPKERIIQVILQDITSRKTAELFQTCISSILDATLQAESIEQLFTTLHSIIKKLMPADNFYFALYDPATRMLNFPYFVDPYDPPPLPRKLGKWVTDYVLRHKKSLLATPAIFIDLIEKGEIESRGVDSIDWLGVPLTLKGETIGVMAIQSYNNDYRYRKEDQEILEFASAQIALAIQRKQSEESRQKTEALISSFLDFVPAATFVKNQQDQVLYVNQFIKDIFEKKSWVGKSTKDLFPVEVADQMIADDQLAINNGLLIKDETLLDAKGIKHVFQTYRFPIKRQDEPNLLGGIAIDTTDRTQAEEQMQRQLDRLSALRTIDLTISGNVDLKVTLDILVDQVVSKLKVDAVDVLTANEIMHELEYAAGKGFITNTRQHARLRIGEEYAGQAALNRNTIKINNLSCEDTPFSNSQFIQREGFCSYLAVPLVSKGQVKGVLEIFNRTALDPDQEWLDFLQDLAMQAAIAIFDSRLFENLQRTNTELIVAYDETIEGWARALELRDLETSGHTRRVTLMTERLALRLGYENESMVFLRRGAMLHDIGKMAIPDKILLKTSALSQEESDIIHQHPSSGYKLLSPISFLRPALEIPLCHHEKWDGTGYPRGLKGEEIPMAARIFAIVDVWDALISDRPYRLAWPEETAIRYISSQSGRHFDPRVVDEFMKLREEK